MNTYTVFGYICGIFITAYGLSRLASNGPKHPWKSFSEFWNTPGATVIIAGLGMVIATAIIIALSTPH